MQVAERLWLKLGFVACPAGRQNVVVRKSASSGATDVKAPTADAMSQCFNGDVAHDGMKALEDRLDGGTVRMIVRVCDDVGVVCVCSSNARRGKSPSASMGILGVCSLDWI